MTPGLVGGIFQGVGSLLGGFSKLFTAHRQKKMANAIHPVRTFYEVSPYAKENKAIALNEMNGVMPGTTQAQNGIAQAQAATINNGNRVATNSADALALAAGSQATASQAQDQLAGEQAQYAHGATKDVMGANDALTTEADKVYQDKLMDYQELQERKQALLGASMQNKANAWSGFGSTLMSGGNALMGAQKWSDIGKNPYAY